MNSLDSLIRLCDPSEPRTAVAPRTRKPDSESRASVLVVEDHAEVAECMRCALDQMRVYSAICHEGETALKMAEVMHFDLIILDILLPRMNGLEVCRTIRKTPHLRAVPVMFVSCVTGLETQAEAALLGAVHFLCKPFELVEFQTQVERILIATSNSPVKN